MCDSKTPKAVIPGHEVICEAVTCIHNDNPVCKIHTQDKPIKLCQFGSCIKFRFSQEKALQAIGRKVG
jgi:hypothetical protein